MASRAKPARALRAWLGIPWQIEKAIEGLGEKALDLRGGEEGWSIRETAHHLVEANLVASNIIIAALAKSERPFDWSWVNPGAEWMKRVGYDKAPLGPALDTLRALAEHIAAVIGVSPDALRRKVRLLDAPGARLYAKTVADILRDQVEHAQAHVRDVKRTRAAHGR